MPPTDPPPPSPGRRTLFTAALLVAFCGAAFAIGWGASGGGAPTDVPKREPAEPVAVAAARMPDDTPVIGVSAGGRHRAYPLHLLLRPDAHVLNDLLWGVPVTVTFCDLDNCVKAFTAPGRDQPLNVAVGGADPDRPRKMLLRVGSDRYWQDTGLPHVPGATGRFPYPETESIRTTWGAWRAAHPDTDVYPGGGN